MTTEIPEKEQYRIRRAAAHEIGHFDTRAWLAMARLFGLHYPWTEMERIDFLTTVKKRYYRGTEHSEDTEHCS